MVTVALCTYNRGALAVQALESALPQLPPDAEVVVVDQSRGPTPLKAFCARDTRIVYLRIALPGLTNARNVALSRASREFIYYLDDDAVLLPGAMAAHLEEIRKPDVGGSTGPIFDHGVIPDPRLPHDVGRITFAGRHIHVRDSRDPQKVQTVFGGNMIFKRKALVEAGGFETGFEGLATWEETDCSFRLARKGWTLAFNPAAGVLHYPQATGNAGTGRGGRSLDYYRNYVRNGTCTFLRGRPRWQQVPFILRHWLMCEKKAVFSLGRPGLGTLTFLRGYTDGRRLYRKSGDFPVLVCDAR